MLKMVINVGIFFLEHKHLLNGFLIEANFKRHLIIWVSFIAAIFNEDLLSMWLKLLS